MFVIDDVNRGAFHFVTHIPDSRTQEEREKQGTESNLTLENTSVAVSPNGSAGIVTIMTMMMRTFK